MRSVLPWLAVVGLSIAAFVHYGNNLPHLKRLASVQQSKDANSAEAKDSAPAVVVPSDKMVAFVSPLQQLMDGAGADGTAEKAPESRPLGKPSPKDLIAPSPVGTGGVILHKTFPVAYAVNFPFVIPAHAATPQLRGHYESFSHQNGSQASDENTDIGFLVMNEEQYADFINRQPADALFSVDSSHDQDINFGLPASQNQPAKFYLVFRNNRREGKKTVKADFSVEF